MATQSSTNKYSNIIREIAGSRLDNFSRIMELQEICKNWNVCIEKALKLSDYYVTLYQASEKHLADIQTKVNERIQKMK